MKELNPWYQPTGMLTSFTMFCVMKSDKKIVKCVKQWKKGRCNCGLKNEKRAEES